MGRRALPLTALKATVLVAAIACLTTACGSDRVYEDAVENAEAGVAVHLEITARETSNLLATHASLSDVSQDQIAAAFLNDLRGYTGDTAAPSDKRAVYDIAEMPDGTVTFSVFFGSSTSGAGGLVTTNQSRHSCATISGRFTEATLTVDDAECPAVIEQLAGEESIPVSMTENAAKHGVDVGALQ